MCPQQCIRGYEINQTHCLHCGLCKEECLAGAIKKRGE
ncbi:4Fe-4S binding protein [Anaerostipes amylophilus]